MPDTHPPDDYASLSEVRVALRQITRSQFKDLNTFAVTVCWTMAKMGYFDGDQIFNEALDKLANGDRRWNRTSDPTIVGCFRGVINSLRSNRIEQLRASRVLVIETGNKVPGGKSKVAVKEIKTRMLERRDLDWMPRGENVERIVSQREMCLNGMRHFKRNPYCVGYLACVFHDANSTPADMVALLESDPLLAKACGFSDGEIMTAINFYEAKRKISKWILKTYSGLDLNPEHSMTNATGTGIDDQNDDGELRTHGNDDFGTDDAKWPLAARKDEQS